MIRSEQILENTWNLENMFNQDDLNTTLEICEKIVKDIKTYQNKLNDSNKIIEVLEKYFNLLITLENVYVYYSHSQDVDFTNTSISSSFNMIKQKYNQYMTEISFLIPEISKVDNDILVVVAKYESEFNNQESIIKICPYSKFIENILHNKEKYLSDVEERIISTYNLNSSAFAQLYSVFTNSEMKYQVILDKDENVLEMSEGLYSKYIRDNDRVLRKNSFEELLKTYKLYNETLTTNYLSDIKQDLIEAKIRNYDSTLIAALEPNKIDSKIYFNLIECIENNIHINHEYVKLRKDTLGYQELHLYDMYTSLVSEIDKEYLYDDAWIDVIDTLKVFSKEYQDALLEAKNDRWIDIYENEAKRTGAYSGGSYLSKPYILLNYHNNINDLFTLIHELGHSMHSYFANKYNPYQNANYKIFIAEIASIVNEILLINNLLDKAKDTNTKKYLINYLLDQFRTTLIRQTMFARFEYDSHQLVENNQVVGSDILNDLYYKINQEYFGNDVIVDEYIKYEWSRIPHFYYNYYVYQYATSFCISLNIVKRILDKEEGIVDKYLDFLKIGDSMYPVDAIKTLDIDLTNSDIFEDAMKQYHYYIEEFKKC